MYANGHVIPSTPISIDIWDVKRYPQAKLFFLSHFHADHIVGLTSSWQYPIYASPLTCKLLIHKLKVKPSLVKCLELGEDHLIPMDANGHEMLTVTLFDANHCPGSVMFLFSGYFGNILYTGDFRYKSDILQDFQLPQIDVLYLDNTYCSPKCMFPTREDAIEAILSQLSTCLLKSDRVFLGLDNLGKEDLLEQIVKERKCKICVKQSRKEVMTIIGYSDIITTTESDTNIYVIPTNEISGRNFEKWNKERRTHAILATARYCGLNFKPFAKFSDIHVIPYSNHSSYTEIKKFVQEIQPSAIIPIVSKHAKGMFGTDISDRADMGVFKKFLRESKPCDIIIPESVKKVMNCCEKSNAETSHLKKRKIAKPLNQPRRKLQNAGIRYIVSEDSETDSDPDAIHVEGIDSQFIPIKKLKTLSDDISEYNSNSNDEDSNESDNTYEITLVTSNGSQGTFLSN